MVAKLCSRRDGSPFMNMLMIAPLCDSRGKIRYFIGAQVDVSGLVKDCTDLESLQQLIQREQSDNTSKNNDLRKKDEFQELSEMLNMAELEIIRKHGGRMHREYQDDDPDNTHSKTAHLPRLLLQEPSSDISPIHEKARGSGRLSGIYQNVSGKHFRCDALLTNYNQYFLIRPYPSFRILFASPTLRIPGILQSPFLERIGGSSRVRNELSTALAEGRGVTAKIRWLSRYDEEGRNRWIHCTPLIGSNGQIGVWMVVLVDDDQEINQRWRQAPPVRFPHRGKVYGSQVDSAGSIESSAGKQNVCSSGETSIRRMNQDRQDLSSSSVRSASPSYSVVI